MTTERGRLPAVPRRLMGLAYFAAILAFLGLTIAAYDKVFTTVTTVTLRAGHIGNQLTRLADVKLRGVLVGEVREITTSGDGTSLTLALDPRQATLIPADVTARLLPKTLFGERYVDLVEPAHPASARLTEGAVIHQDTSAEAVELNQILDKLMPVLQAVQPQKLSTTLNAVSDALDGRGEQLGQTLTRLGDYVRRINPSVPDLTADLAALPGVADTYDQAAPDLLQALSDLTTTTKTIAQQQDSLRSLYSDLTTTGLNLRDFLAANKDNLIRVTSDSRPTLDLLERYAPEYPCLTKQLADFGPKLDDVWGGADGDHKLHLTIEIANSRGKYVPGQDTPAYDEHRGPRCYSLQPGEKAPQYPEGRPIQDGSSPVGGGGAALANSGAEQQLLSALLAPQLGVPQTEVPSWSSLLVGPLYRGTEVTVR
ncbi:MCE family protein [Amycolatopsis sp. NPDC001319]|uniref:MCE family protein n=1 Tax=unclassified Amycolatopsis TaxID=2618356 RepID=UPI0036A606B7